MNKKLSPKYSDDVKISNIQYRKNVKDNSKVDINILLNRVKLQKTEIKKKIFYSIYKHSLRYMYISLSNFFLKIN